MVVVTEQLVGDTVVAGIDHDVDIVAADRLLDQTLGVAALEAGAVTGDDKGVLLVADFLGPVDQITVDEAGKLLGTGAGDQSQLRNLSITAEKVLGIHIIDRHTCTPHSTDDQKTAHTAQFKPMQFYFITKKVFFYCYLSKSDKFCSLHSVQRLFVV